MSTLLEAIRTRKPLIHHITNWVTIWDCAQAVRQTGALPVMAHAKEEVAEMQKIASVLVLNIGTLTNELIEAMLIAGKAANKKGNPIVLDAVGAGATQIRTEATKRLLEELKIAILKGNAGEIAVIAGVEAEVRGVESMGVSGDIKETAERLAKTLNNIVVVTGVVDIITDGERLAECKCGHEMMGKVVGTGCMAASILGCFAAVADNYFTSSVEAMTYYGKAGERAAKKTNQPVEYKMRLLDELSV